MTLATGGSKIRELATTRELATSLELDTTLELANMFLLVLTFAARGSFLGAIEIDERGVRVRRRVGSATQRAIDVSVGVSENLVKLLEGEASSR